MEYGNIVKLIEIDDFNTANQYIECGWVLITPKTCYNPYIFGWDKTKGEIVEPPKPPEIGLVI